MVVHFHLSLILVARNYSIGQGALKIFCAVDLDLSLHLICFICIFYLGSDIHSGIRAFSDIFVD